MFAETLALAAVLVAAAPSVAASASPSAPTTRRAEVSLLESLEPQEHVLQDGSRAGSLVYVDPHGDLMQVRYLAGPAAGPRGFQLVELPVEATSKDSAKDSATRQIGIRSDVLEEPEEVQEQQEQQESAPALQVILPPQEVRRAPTPRPSDAFWQPKENSDVTRKERSEMRRPPPAHFARMKRLQPLRESRSRG